MQLFLLELSVLLLDRSKSLVAGSLARVLLAVLFCLGGQRCSFSASMRFEKSCRWLLISDASKKSFILLRILLYLLQKVNDLEVKTSLQLSWRKRFRDRIQVSARVRARAALLSLHSVLR